MKTSTKKNTRSKRPHLMKIRDRHRALVQFGLRLKELREAKGLAPVNVALRSGIDGSNLLKYEAGRREPGLLFIVLVAKALEVHPSELLSFEFDFELDYQAEI
jgi:transcriptional regulator with XRE-family HTH domain